MILPAFSFRRVPYNSSKMRKRSTLRRASTSWPSYSSSRVFLCVAELSGAMLAALGIVEGPNVTTMKWLLPGYVMGLCLVCYGVLLLDQAPPGAPQWIAFGMTLFLTVQLAMAPAGDSPFYSAPRIYLNRMLLVLPLIASCAYLARRGSSQR